MKVIALSGRGNIGKTSCLGHLINLIYQETTGRNYLVEGEDVRVTLDYHGSRITICTWGDTDYEENLNIEKIQEDNPDIAIVATRSKMATVEIVKQFCADNGYQLKRVEKYVASFDNLSGQEYLNNLQAEQLLDYVQGLINGQLYYVDSISTLGEANEMYHVTLLDAEIPDSSYPRSLSLEMNAQQLLYQNSNQQIRENDFVLYRPDSDHQFRYGNEEPRAIELRNENHSLEQELVERQLNGDAALAILQRKPDEIKSYHIKVGHGNCSLILMVFGIDYELWMVDCSVFDYLIRRDYGKCLDQCLSDIAGKLNIAIKDLRVSKFMLTHKHFDHYSGLSYLIKKGVVDGNTIVYANMHYDCSSPVWNNILKEFIKIKCHFVEPIYGNLNTGAICVYHPECRIYQNNSSVQVGVVNRIVTKVNDSSVVYGIELDGKIMVFPGDLERYGFVKMSTEGKCQPNLYNSDYYVVSHHGSGNGHPTMPCANPRKARPTPLACVTTGLKKAILMGRDGAYTGIYDSRVTGYWGAMAGVLEYTEYMNDYLELDWKSGVVTKH